jgi:hypothetical protein
MFRRRRFMILSLILGGIVLLGFAGISAYFAYRFTSPPRRAFETPRATA